MPLFDDLDVNHCAVAKKVVGETSLLPITHGFSQSLLQVLDRLHRQRIRGLAEARDYAEAIVGTVHNPMIVLDGSLHVRSANPAFYRYFVVNPKDTEGQLVYELGNGQWSSAELRKLLVEMLPSAGQVSDFVVEHDFPRIGRRTMVLNAQRIVGYDDRPDLILLVFDDATEQKQAERHREMLISELSHRVKNSLAVIQSIATQTLRSSKTLEDFGGAFMGRIQALARGHDIALKSGFQQIALATIVDQALKPFEISGRIRVDRGPLVEFASTASQALTLMLHEMATNAVKYGALSGASGAVAIAWRVEDDGDGRRVALSWIESGGPPVIAPVSAGQGTQFIKGGIRYELRGEVALDFQPGGLHATITIPLKTHASEAGAAKGNQEPSNGVR